MTDRTFSDEVLQRLRELDSTPFEEKFRAAWSRIAPHQGVTEQPSSDAKARAVWRMCFSQALAECLDPKSYASMCKPPRARAVPGGSGTAGTTMHVIPFGRTAGTPLNKADTRDLSFTRGRLQEWLGNPARARFHEDNRALLNAIEAELKTRAA